MEGKKKALIISISDYNDENLTQLEFCKNDGEEMYQTLIKLGYEIPENQKIIGKAGKKTVEDSIIDFFENKDGTISDTLLFYFSGHGVLGGISGRFFGTTNVSISTPQRDGVRFEMLNEEMARSFVDKKIAILDCCFSGDAVPDIVGKSNDDAGKEAEILGSEGLHKTFDKSQGSCILASSLSNKRSFALEDNSRSAFTNFIIKGLKGAKDSVDENGYVTPEKLSTYVYTEMQKIPELACQKPVRNLSISGNLILAEYPPKIDINFTMKEATVYFEAKEFEKAIRLLDLVLKTNPKNVDALNGKGKALSHLSKMQEAIEFYDQALELDPKSIDALFSKGNALNILTQFQEAIHCYDKAIEIDPKSVDILYCKGNALHGLGNYQEAILWYEKALSIDPKYVRALFNVGNALSNLGKLHEAIIFYDKALEIEPKTVDLLNNKGNILHNLGKYQEAIQCYDQALETNPDDFDVLYNKSNSLHNLGKYQEAIQCFDKARKIESRN